MVCACVCVCADSAHLMRGINIFIDCACLYTLADYIGAEIKIAAAQQRKCAVAHSGETNILFRSMKIDGFGLTYFDV